MHVCMHVVDLAIGEERPCMRIVCCTYMYVLYVLHEWYIQYIILFNSNCLSNTRTVVALAPPTTRNNCTSADFPSHAVHEEKLYWAARDGKTTEVKHG